MLIFSVEENNLGLACNLGKLYIAKKELPTSSNTARSVLEKRIKIYCAVKVANSQGSRTIRDDARQEQEAAGITVNRDFTLEDVEKMQTYYGNNYQIVVYNEVWCKIQFSNYIKIF